MTAAALIACSNGYGHVRRTAAIAARLSALGVAVSWFAERQAAERFLSWPALRAADRRKIDIIDFDTFTSAARLRSGDPLALDWHRRLPDLSPFDVVLSDNLPEVLELRGDAVLCGHFFWHDVLDGLPASYVSAAERLIAHHNPIVISSDLFTMPAVGRGTRLRRVGLFDLLDQAQVGTRGGRNLLIACGHGGEAVADTRRLVMSLLAHRSVPFRTIFVEPELMPEDAPSWMRAADFSPYMYAGLLAAACRPGIGTVTDCLIAGARIFAYGEASNREIAHNAQRLAELDLGAACIDAADAAKRAWSYAEDIPAQGRHLQAVRRHCRADGAAEAAGLLLEACRAGR